MVKVTVFSKVFAHPTVSSENHLLKRQYEKHFFSFVLSFFVALAVVEPKSKIRTAGQDHDRQYKREKYSGLLSKIESGLSQHCGSSLFTIIRPARDV